MIIPELRNPKTQLRIVAVDPGTSHLGLAVLDWEWGKDLAEVVWAGTIHVNDESSPGSFSETHGNRDYRLSRLSASWKEFLRISCPTFVTTETPFMRRAKLSAYESGVELQKMLRDGLWEVLPGKYLHGFMPIIVKAHVGVVAKGTDKSHMFTAVTNMYGKSTLVDLSVLDEHSIDAIAVANTFVRMSLLQLNNLLPPKPPRDPSKSPRRGRRRRKKGGKK